MPKLIDLTGKRFGKLIVLSRNKNNTKNNHPRWNCRCDCGKEIIVQGSHLRSGHTQSCGCVQKKIAGNINFKDISGQKFGNLTAIKYIKSNDKGSAIWKCKCNCGNIISVDRTHLVGRGQSSCGCKNSIGELNINKLLTNNNIIYKSQYTNSDLRTDKNGYLKYDFAILENSKVIRLIEFDGPQHYKQENYFGNLEIIQHRDNLKNNYAKENNIPLVRIPYYKRNCMTLEDLMGDRFLV